MALIREIQCFTDSLKTHHASKYMLDGLGLADQITDNSDWVVLIAHCPALAQVGAYLRPQAEKNLRKVN
jgi:hypothetical protein